MTAHPCALAFVLLAASLTVTAGCPSGFAPPALTDAASDLFDGGNVDLRPDLLPGSCLSACDCPSGAGCTNGTCGGVGFIMMCCTQDNGACAGINLCQYRSGLYSQCNSPDAGTFTFDGGTTGCANFLCQSDDLCRAVCGSQTATCLGAGSGGMLGRCLP